MNQRVVECGSIWFFAACSAIWAMLAGPPGADAAEPRAKAEVIEPRFVHLRSGSIREWSSFPEMATSNKLEVRFDAKGNAGEYCLRLRQQDVKQSWKVLLNEKPIGNLVRDEADLIVFLPIPTGRLVDGKNTLRIESSARGAKDSDDIRVGEMRLESRPAPDARSEATLEIEVYDSQSKQSLPARITITDKHGTLIETAAVSSEFFAARPGVVYTSTGGARLGVPAGEYVVYAGRGFEYSFSKVEVALEPGQSVRRELGLRREVPTPGYAASDTHIHTLTHSGHGDATIDERMITLAGEGIELPIATDHNRHIDYEPHARRLNVRKYFTPIVGNEMTTSVGHFNVFPAIPSARVPDYKATAWRAIFDEIFATPEVKVAILNHARDLHGGTRPFGPKLFNETIGEHLDDWPMRFNGLEVINSGATQTDPLRLFHDWMALLNRGYLVTPVGSSDSHDVARYIVGQGRTYIRCDDRNSGALDVDSAVTNFLAGRVMVSYGLLAELTMSGKYHSGDLAAPIGKEIHVSARVLGPHWVKASRILLFANGQLLREEKIAPVSEGELPVGVKWHGEWTLPRPAHDVHLVAIALGPGITGAYWPTAKPYQPTSPDWTPYVLGSSGAIWVDADGDGRRSSARDYAERLFAASKGDFAKLLTALATFDAAVAAQAAHLYRTSGGSFESEEFSRALKAASPPAQAGFQTYLKAWRENERSRLDKDVK